MDESERVAAALEAGTADFLGYDFFVERGVLVPRAVTEVMIRACETLVSKDSARLLMDVGCGAGIIGVSLAHKFPQARVICLDISEDAVRVTRRNIQKHGLGARMEVRQSDLFQEVPEFLGQVDAILCSPPFISTGRLAGDRAHLLELEPRTAFDAGPYGISLHKRLVTESKPMLQEKGWLILECGQGQEHQVRRLLERAGDYEGFTEFRELTNEYVACSAASLGRHSMPPCS